MRAILAFNGLNIVVNFLHFDFTLQNQTSIFHWQTFQNLDMCDTLRDLVPFGQRKEREKHSRRKDLFIKVAG